MQIDDGKISLQVASKTPKMKSVDWFAAVPSIVFLNARRLIVLAKGKYSCLGVQHASAKMGHRW